MSPKLAECGPNTLRTPDLGHTLDTRVNEMCEWLARLDALGFPLRSVAIALDVSTETVRRWQSGRTSPRVGQVNAVRMLLVLAKVSPVVARGVSWWLAGEFADEVDKVQLRALTSWERRDKRVPGMPPPGAWQVVTDGAETEETE